MKKRILVIGPKNSGKQQLIRLFEDKENLQKMSSIVYYSETIYVPSSYLRCPWMVKHIISVQQNAYCLLMLLDSARSFRVYPPNCAKAFRVHTIGLIRKNQNAKNNRIEDCRKELLEAKVQKIYELDFDDKEDCLELLSKIRLFSKN